MGLGGHGHTLVPRWIVYVTLKLPTMHLTNDVTLKFNRMTILQNLCKDRNYFLHLKKIGTNVQNDYKGKDQNAYSLLIHFSPYTMDQKVCQEQIFKIVNTWLCNLITNKTKLYSVKE